MTKEEILKGEGSHLEFKQEIPEKKENFLKTVSAFSNTSGGTIVFGIDDKTHTIKGLEGDIFKLMDSIINAISDCSLVFKRIVKNNVPQGVPQDVPQDLDGFIINEIKMNNKITREEIARKANVNPKTVARHIEKLKDKVHFVGSGFSGYWQIKE